MKAISLLKTKCSSAQQIIFIITYITETVTGTDTVLVSVTYAIALRMNLNHVSYHV